MTPARIDMLKVPPGIMLIQEQSSESARVYKTRGDALSMIIGIPFVGLGLLSVCIAVVVLFRMSGPISVGVAAMAFIVGFFMLSIAVPAVSTTEGVTLDRLQGTATQWRKIFGRYTALGVHPLNEFRSVEIYSHRKPGSHYYVYYVRLAAGGPKEVVLCAQTLIDRARDTARDASEFLSLPLEDKMGSHDPVLEP